MGIKHFFGWFKNRFESNITRMRRGVTLPSVGVKIDCLMIDLNGLFHGRAQKIYQYGEYKPKPLLMGRKAPSKQRRPQELAVRVYSDVCARIEYLRKIAAPKKRLILCIDGPAPLRKQNQQRQRRFRSAKERMSGEEQNQAAFDSNSITPGTEWMDHLSAYIDWFIRKKMREDKAWAGLDVVFSDEKCAGEGEHKIINYMRRYGNPTETYCIHGADADLIMLSLATHYPHFYILRDDMMRRHNDFFAIDIGSVHKELGEYMCWENSGTKRRAALLEKIQRQQGNKTERRKGPTYHADKAVNDFVLMCFMVGNDFLPHIPGIEIIMGGIDSMVDTYRECAAAHGHLTRVKDGRVKIRKASFKAFVGTLGMQESSAFAAKLGRDRDFFPMPLLNEHSKIVTRREHGSHRETWRVDVDAYKTAYYEAKFPPGTTIKKVCSEYLEGLQWVLSYYTEGVPNWKWRYPYHYAPFCSTLATRIGKHKFTTYAVTQPSTPFIQLLSVLPPASRALLPHPLCELLSSSDSELAPYCPDEFEVDLAGCRQEWEGTVLLPMIDYDHVVKVAKTPLKKVKKDHKLRNRAGKSFRYVRLPICEQFRSRHGNFNSYVRSVVLEGV